MAGPVSSMRVAAKTINTSDSGVSGKADASKKGLISFFSSIIAQIKRVVPFLSVTPSPWQENALSVKQVNDFKINKLQACIDTLDKVSASLENTFEMNSLRFELQSQLTGERARKGGLLQDTENQEDKADNAYILSAKALIPEVINKLASSLKASDSTLSSKSIKHIKKMVKTEFKQADINHLNNANWKTITDEFTHKGKTFISTQTPAAQMQSGGVNIFQVDYNGKGVCSADQRNTTHAVNLYASKFEVTGADGKPITLYEGLRHGVNSPYQLEKGSKERIEGAKTRAKEVVTAALFLDMNKSKLQAALAGEHVTLRLTSTSLLAPRDILGSKEGSQLADQAAAWRELSSNGLLKLSVPGENGELKEIKIKLEVAAFNVPVNERGLTLGLGMKESDAFNQEGLRTFLGKDLSPVAAPGGWVGDYLARQPAPEDADIVRGLARELKTILANKAHHSDGGDPYKLARLLPLLSWYIDATPDTNCKSGKDRTGAEDVEIKFKALQIHQPQKESTQIPGFGPLNMDDKKLLGDMFLHTGNLQVQEANTGGEGNKTFGTSLFRSVIGTSVRTRVGGEVANQVRGLSDLV